MDYYLLALGWWNFVGSLLMIGLFNENFAKKLMNDWTKLFVHEFKLDYWGKLFMGWAIGLNIFYGIINILAVRWNILEMKQLVIGFDVLAYLGFTCLLIWGWRVGRLAKAGFYSSLVIFSTWLLWGIYSLTV